MNNNCVYCSKYHKISNGDQRLKYKSEFNTEYEEYRQLHSRIEGVTDKFVDLRDQLHKQSKESTDYKVSVGNRTRSWLIIRLMLETVQGVDWL